MRRPFPVAPRLQDEKDSALVTALPPWYADIGHSQTSLSRRNDILEALSLPQPLTGATLIDEGVAPGDNILPTLRYRLLCSEVDGRPAYSVFCTFDRPTDATHTPAAYLFDVTSSEETGRRLLASLCRGRVTPFALAETVIEWLG